MTATETLSGPCANVSADRVGPAQLQSARQIVALDLLRFGAAMLVVFHHFAFWAWVRQGIPVHYFYLGGYTWFGWVGVQVFFVLSGFIITYSAQKATPTGFVRSRVIRLYPAAWICSTSTLLMIVLSRTSGLNTSLVLTWLNSFALVPHSRWIDGSYWTLLVEISFYALVFVLLLTRRFGRIGSVIGTIGIASSIVNLYRFAAQDGRFGASESGSLYRHYQLFTAAGWSNRLLLEHGCLFAIGVMLWLCLFDRTTIVRVMVLLVCMTGAMANISQQSVYFVHQAHANYSYVTPLAVWLLSLCCIIASVRYNDVIGKVLGVRGCVIVRRLGLITYPLYLIHQVSGFILLRTYLRLMSDVAALALTILTVLGASWFISVLLETPLQRWLRTVLGTRPEMPMQPPATLP